MGRGAGNNASADCGDGVAALLLANVSLRKLVMSGALVLPKALLLLQRMCTADNHVGHRGAATIALALASNTALTTLDISRACAGVSRYLS